MVSPFVTSFFLWLSKKITGKIFFPKDKKGLLDKENQKTIFKNNLFIINNGGNMGLAERYT